MQKFGNIFKQITGSSRVPRTTVEAWEILEESQNRKIPVQGKLYGNPFAPDRSDVFTYRYNVNPDDIDKRLF